MILQMKKQAGVFSKFPKRFLSVVHGPLGSVQVSSSRSARSRLSSQNHQDAIYLFHCVIIYSDSDGRSSIIFMCDVL